MRRAFFAVLPGPCLSRRGARPFQLLKRTPPVLAGDWAPGFVHRLPLVAVGLGALAGCFGDVEARPGENAQVTRAAGLQAFRAAWVVDGTGAPPIRDGVIVSRDGVVEVIGPSEQVTIPPEAEIVDFEGRWIVPGLVNAHGHVSGDRDAALAQLEQYSYYGVTTVVSLGGETPDGFRLRDEQATPDLSRARIFVAGPVISPSNPDEARSEVARIADMRADWVKIRVDDGLDRNPKMPPDVYRAVIAAAHERGLRVAVHIVDLDDALGVVEAGADLLAHSVRDAPVSQALVDAMHEADVCLVPTFTRELSTFVYSERPEFFGDPFFLERAAPNDLESFLTPELREQQMSPTAVFWRNALPLAQENMRRLHEAGLGIAMGTDTGPRGRFQGYFEHLEMEMMVEAGMTPSEALRSATGVAAACTGLDGTVGTLVPGAWTDLLVLDGDPQEGIENTRMVHSVWIAGNPVR